MSNISYNVRFKDTTWEVIPDKDNNSMTCYNRTAFKTMNISGFDFNEDNDFKEGNDNHFNYEDWMAFTGSDLLRTEQVTKESLPLIYWATQIIGLPKMEKIRDTKYIFSE